MVQTSHQCTWLAENSVSLLSLQQLQFQQQWIWERYVGNAVMQKCLAGMERIRAIFLLFFLSKGEGNTFTRLCHFSQYLSFKNHYSLGRRLKVAPSRAEKLGDQRKILTLSRSVILHTRTIRVTGFPPLSWCGSFLECQWHYCWTAFSVYVPFHYHNLGKRKENIKKTRQKWGLTQPQLMHDHGICVNKPSGSEVTL